MNAAAKLVYALALAVFALSMSGHSYARPPASPVAAVRDILDVSDDKLDYGRAKLKLDQIIDPSIKAELVGAEIDRIAAQVRVIAGANSDERVKLTALRRVLYDSGPWNQGRPFSYDLADPVGRDIRNKLLATYLSSKRGNCVSMPILFLILADRLDLPGAALAQAPLHTSIRYTDNTGRQFNLETTSGAHVARDAWYRENLPMTDQAVDSGLYMRALTRREAVADMASTVVEYLVEQGQYEDAIAVSDVILKSFPRDVRVLAKQGTAYGLLLDVEFYKKFPTPDLIPQALQPRYWMLAEKNRTAFETAEAWGWRAEE